MNLGLQESRDQGIQDPGSRARLGCFREDPKIEKDWKWKKGGLRLQPQAFYFHFQYFSILGLSRGCLNLAFGLASRAMDPGTEFFRKYKIWLLGGQSACGLRQGHIWRGMFDFIWGRSLAGSHVVFEIKQTIQKSRTI